LLPAFPNASYDQQGFDCQILIVGANKTCEIPIRLPYNNKSDRNGTD
jgi:hypothetical protein